MLMPHDESVDICASFSSSTASGSGASASRSFPCGSTVIAAFVDMPRPMHHAAWKFPLTATVAAMPQRTDSFQEFLCKLSRRSKQRLRSTDVEDAQKGTFEGTYFDTRRKASGHFLHDRPRLRFLVERSRQRYH